MHEQFDYNQYRKNIKQSKNNFIPLMIVVIILLLGIALPLNNNRIKSTNFYFVEAQNLTSYSKANALALNLQAENAGGYIYFDGSYHILVGYYINKQDAQNVLKNILEFYPNSKIFTLSASTPKFNIVFNNKDAKQLSYFTQKTAKIIEDIYDLIIDFDTTKSQKNTTLKIENLQAEFNTDYNAFISYFKDDLSILQAKENAKKISESITNLNDKIEENSTQKLKYELIKIVINYFSFLSSF